MARKAKEIVFVGRPIGKNQLIETMKDDIGKSSATAEPQSCRLHDIDTSIASRSGELRSALCGRSMDLLVVCIEMKDIKLERNEDHKRYCGDVINELRLLGIQLGIDIWKYVIIVLIKVDALRLSTKEFVRRP